jgi:hypothetical protein
VVRRRAVLLAPPAADKDAQLVMPAWQHRLDVSPAMSDNQPAWHFHLPNDLPAMNM